MKREYRVRQHGTYEGFKHGCDCDECYGAFKKVSESRATGSEWALFENEKKPAGRPRKVLLEDRDIKHGGPYAYNVGCRCDKCLAWRKADYVKRRERSGRKSREEYNAYRRANPKHGITRYVKEKCRCNICVTAYRTWYESRSEAIKARQRRYSERNREKTRERSRLYHQNHKEQIRARNQERYALRGKAKKNG